MDTENTWRIAVTHETSYVYESPVTASFNELRMTPKSSTSQFLLQHHATVVPAALLSSYVDYWGTTVEFFDVQTDHTLLRIASENIVDVSMPSQLDATITWARLDDENVIDQFSEFLEYSDLVNAVDHGLQRHVFTLPMEAVNAAVALVRTKLSYIPGSTHVFTSAGEAWNSGSGVCQDYTHVLLSMLRSLGIPARYVSGYHSSGNGVVGEIIQGESHAWVEVWLGQWSPIDPTNGKSVAQQHVVVATGRDYHDVSPMRGIFSGGKSRAIDVSVKLERLPR